jgi:hypothetical protein
MNNQNLAIEGWGFDRHRVSAERGPQGGRSCQCGLRDFKGSPYISSAREAGQDSRDAPGRADGPVQVSYDLLTIKREEVPFADRLEHAIGCCLEIPWVEKTREHLGRALETIAAD